MSRGRMLRPPGGIAKSVGRIGGSRSIEASIEAVDSTVSLTHLMPVQVPVKRLMAMPSSP